MPITYVSGDPLHTRAHVLAFGYNRKARTELSPLEMKLRQENPAAFATYKRQCHKDNIKAGQVWLWRETSPTLMFMVIRDTSVGATRLRYVQACVLYIARDYRLEGIKSLAIAPLGQPGEWAEIKKVLGMWLGKSKLPVIVYDEYHPGVQADEEFE